MLRDKFQQHYRLEPSKGLERRNFSISLILLSGYLGHTSFISGGVSLQISSVLGFVEVFSRSDLGLVEVIGRGTNSDFPNVSMSTNRLWIPLIDPLIQLDCSNTRD
jgi:hypothetical protein